MFVRDAAGPVFQVFAAKAAMLGTEASRKGTPRYAKGMDLKIVRDAADPILQVFIAKVNQ
jgi:hypothetical protein